MNGIGESASPQIVLRPVGSPLTLGMSGLAIASLVQSGVELHWLPSGQTSQAGLILIAVPFVLQLLACIFSYLARDGTTGAAVGILATSWLAVGLIHIVVRPGATSGALGLLLVAASGALGAAAGATVSSKPLPGAIFAVAAMRFATAGIFQLSTVGSWSAPLACLACSSPPWRSTPRWPLSSRTNTNGPCCPPSAAAGPPPRSATVPAATVPA